MNAITFDTLKFAQRLRDEVKLPPEQAEKYASVLADTFADWQGQQQLASKADITLLETKIAESKSEIIKWVVGMFVAQSGLLLGVLKLHN